MVTAVPQRPLRLHHDVFGREDVRQVNADSLQNGPAVAPDRGARVKRFQFLPGQPRPVDAQLRLNKRLLIRGKQLLFATARVRSTGFSVAIELSASSHPVGELISPAETCSLNPLEICVNLVEEALPGKPFACHVTIRDIHKYIRKSMQSTKT